MHTIDYNFKLERWEMHFIHATSSALATRILEDGILKPNLNGVFDVIFERFHQFAQFRAEFEDAHEATILMPKARMNENFEGLPVSFSTYLLNITGLNVLSSEIDRVFRHGGEVYAQTIFYLQKFLIQKGINANLNAIYNDSEKYFFVIKTYAKENFDERVPRTSHRRIKDILERILDKEQNILLNDILEVQFLADAPKNSIIFHGTYTQIHNALSTDPLSPAARERLRAR